MRSNSRGGFVDLHCAPIHERVGKRLADGYQRSAQWLWLSSGFASVELVGVGLLQPEA